eukprot:GHVQ01025367.1.p2 GENE.GHVQ01025367.1~~GHVQ01025367.1.p2  ORF type:complete len:117 (+),score=21.64 GHVQ01025367.1:222-572(+)
MYHFEMLMTDRHVGARQHEEEVSLQSSSMRHDAAVVNERTPKFGIGRWSTCLLHFNGFSKWLPDSPTIRMMALMVSIAAAGVVLWKGRGEGQRERVEGIYALCMCTYMWFQAHSHV